MEIASSSPSEIFPPNGVNQGSKVDSRVGVATFSSSSSTQHRRRRGGEKMVSRPRRRQQAFGREIGHAAAETYLLARLSFKLLSYLGIGYRWITRLLSLTLYAMFLMPGFVQVGFLYFFSSQIRRSVVYGDQPRNRLDLYLPTNSDGPKPVVAFVTGGAWIIGYKAWGSLLGLQLAERDVIVACIDYRNFPQGTISDMVADVSRGIAYICENVVEFGGDPDKIYLMGQSAGAHIGACVLMQQAIKESRGDSISWSVSQMNAYFGLSGGYIDRYNLPKLVDHFHSRGLYRSIFLSIMEGQKSLEQFSPEMILQNPSSKNAISLLPRIVLFHGTSDYSIPSDASKMFVETLQKEGVRADLILYDGKTHTDLFLQDPLRGGKDKLFDDLVALIHADDEEALARDALAPPKRRFVPEILLRLGRQVSPF
ncbi:isoprenylcysteine alpha-carbonyl methylesterase ICME-like isoform X1 [Primulina tabacum]|uniref:isoprenylcysteine alpha-carbonyl methylesterase ICME-like isoform X1 n=1 Tax=Primulina tabacum TaxID=48773 RepID=UPI003F5A3A41